MHRSGRPREILPCIATVAVFFFAAREAKANGAFPDGLDVLLPADRSDSLALATNFGVISSGDDGQTWQWVCEEPLAMGATLYSLGPSPDDTIYALSSMGLVHSEDNGCSWLVAGGDLGVIWPVDYFADPNDSQHVLAIGRDYRVGPPADAVFSSSDAAKTFTNTVYAGPSGAVLTGVEIARGAPQTIYVLMLLGGAGGRPSLVRSNDSGTTWTAYDLSPSLGAVSNVLLMTVDPKNPLRVFVRVQGVSSERLAIVDVGVDGGPTEVRTPIEVAASLTGLVFPADGSVLVSALDENDMGHGFQSSDGAVTFAPWPTSGALPALRGLAERGGLLYGAADDLGADGFALGVSSDQGATWTPIMKYSQVQSVAACSAAQCLTTCQYEVSLGLWGPAVCGPVSDASAEAAAPNDADADTPIEVSTRDATTGAPSGSKPATPIVDAASPAPLERPSDTHPSAGCALSEPGRGGRQASAPARAAPLLSATWLAYLLGCRRRKTLNVHGDRAR